ncbi:MAG: 30S ribosomal protein S5 [Candidatus ainarchaeum sp.]|nr:30S ribosomal protein S5 [Candidatus ainarchaeum sp.]
MNRKKGTFKREESLEEQVKKEISERERMISDWVPKTELGRMVKLGQITNLDEIFEKGYKIKEPKIIDMLLSLEEEVVDVSKTTRVVRSGRKFSYRATVIVGNKNGYIGVGTGKDVDRFPAINKAKNDARLKIKKIYRGSGSWEDQPTDDLHSVPFTVIGKEGSVRVKLMPAPKGTGLAVGKNIRNVLVLAGIQNAWGKATGRSSIKLNFVRAAIDALYQTSQIKVSKDIERKYMKQHGSN